MASLTLDLAGIILNIVAGLLMSLDFIFQKAWIEKADNWIKKTILKVIFSEKDPDFVMQKMTEGIIFLFIISNVVVISSVVSFPYIEFHVTKTIDSILIFIYIVSSIFISSRLILLLPKGALASLGIILFILGNVLQLWATFQ